MGKVKRKFVSLKWSFFVYLPICFLLAFIGSMAIGLGTNHLQDYYENLHSDVRLNPPSDKELQMFIDDGKYFNVRYVVTDGRPFADKKYMRMYFIISYAQFILIPLWVVSCVAITGIIFYRRELHEPIRTLLDASEKISGNQLYFKIECQKQNELGQLCTAFDNMRQTLCENNRNMWRSLEERKRLNSAFSHDLRTPLTVLKGYNDFLTNYIGNIPEEKIREILTRMDGQINRLESYTYKMSAVQKLEDIIPDITEIRANMLRENLTESGKYICKDKNFSLRFETDRDSLFIDSELVMEVYENIMSNAERYADRQIAADISITEDILKITISDDGDGFSEKALRLAKEPFYRDDKEQNSLHFGLGLYISKIICEKCDGSIYIANSGEGGKVTTEFFCGNR